MRIKGYTVRIGISLSVILVLALTGAFAQESSKPVGEEAFRNFKLVGTIEGDLKIAGAIFEDPQTKKQNLYRVGDVIEGATILEIKHQQVLLKRGEEFMLVPITGGSPGKRQPGDPIPIPEGTGNPEQALGKVLSQQIAPYDSRLKKTAVSRSVVDRFVENLQGSTEDQTLLVKTPLGPALNLSNMERDILSNLGLTANDLIVGISGMGLGSPERLAQIFGILGQAKVFNLSVLRGSVVEPLSYEIRSEE